MLNPKFAYRVYNRAGTLIRNLPVDRVKSEPRFTENINGWQGNITLLLAWDVTDSPVSVGNILHVAVFWEGYSANGDVVFRGSVEKIQKVLDTSEQLLSVEVYGLAYFFWKIWYRDAGSVTFSKNQEPKTTIEAMIDHLNTEHNFFSKNIELYGWSLNSNYSYTYCLDVIKDFAMRTKKYYFIDSTWLVTFRSKPVTATWTLDFWYDVQKITTDEDIIDAVNFVAMQYTGGFRTDNDATSITNIWKRESKQENDKIADSASADDAASNFIDENKGSKQGTIIVLNSRADLLAIKPWDTVTVQGIDAGVVNLQVYKKTYNINSIVLELEKVTSLASVLLA